MIIPIVVCSSDIDKSSNSTRMIQASVSDERANKEPKQWHR